MVELLQTQVLVQEVLSLAEEEVQVPQAFWQISFRTHPITNKRITDVIKNISYSTDVFEYLSSKTPLIKRESVTVPFVTCNSSSQMASFYTAIFLKTWQKTKKLHCNF